MVRKKKAQQLVLPKMHAALHCKAKIIIKSGFSGIIGAEQPPDLNNLKAAFYGFKDDRKAGDIDKSTTLCVKSHMRSDQRFLRRMLSYRTPHPACGGFFLLVDSL